MSDLLKGIGEMLTLAFPFYRLDDAKEKLADFRHELHFLDTESIQFPRHLLESEIFCNLLNNLQCQSIDPINGSNSSGDDPNR